MILNINLQIFNFAWGVGIFSGEERSEIWRFLGRFRNSPEWPESKTEACRDQDFFQNFHHGTGGSVNFTWWFSRRSIACFRLSM